MAEFDYTKLQFDYSFLNLILENKQYNKVIEKYYVEMIHEQEEYQEEHNKISLFYGNIHSQWYLLSECCKALDVDYYVEAKIKDIQSINRCKNKFCNNCKKVTQAMRMAKFIPLVSEQENLYHVVLTVPNVEGSQLEDTIKNIFKSFKYLIRYFKQVKNISGMDFAQYGYLGAIRNLEITFDGDSYHPHLHCAFAFDFPLSQGIFKKNIINTYSRSNASRKINKFSEFEIMIQKIWRLLIDGVKVTKKNIDVLPLGYSCKVDKFRKDDYLELFKYMTKATDEKDKPMSYKNFKVLHQALHGARSIQGYGVFFRVEDDDEFENMVDEFYNDLINQLLEKENPLEISQSPEDLLRDIDNIVITRRKVYQYLKTIK